jgi:hypothetical protein
VTIRIGAQRDTLANAYAAAAPYLGGASADPGNTGAANNELAGGTYGRVALNWSNSAGGAGQVAGSGTLNVAAGQTLAWVFVASTNVAGAATVRDTYDLPDQAFVSAGTETVSVTYTQT